MDMCQTWGPENLDRPNISIQMNNECSVKSQCHILIQTAAALILAVGHTADALGSHLLRVCRTGGSPLM